MHAAADRPRLTPRQRWLVAQRLGAADSVDDAASFAGVAPEAVDAALAEPRFRAQVAAEAERAGLSGAAWVERMRVMVRQATEVALADGKVSTVSTLLRASLVLPALAAAPAARAATARAVAQAGPGMPEVGDAEVGEVAQPVEPDPAREARRLELLARANPVLRPGLAHTPLDLLEGFAAATDPDLTVYESWFGAQAKAPAETVTLAEEDVAAIRHVTRHNPPWLRGDYLGYHRPPVPLAAFAADAAGVPATRAKPEPVAAPSAPAETAGEALAGLRARVERLLDPVAPRTAEELDLAEAVCAVSWPNWPAYRGPLDLALLRRVLRKLPVDANALHRLGSRELAEACGAATAPVMAQGP